EATRVATVVDELEPLLRRLVGEQVVVVLDVHDTPAVDVDRGQLELVLLELVANATEAMEGKGGALTITARPVSLVDGDADAVTPGAYVELAVQDTGIGMDAATRTRLGDPFFTTKGDGHSGLGLTMVRTILDEQSAGIAFESDPGRGTTACVVLPAAS